jgi:adenylosuccinate synthase
MATGVGLPAGAVDLPLGLIKFPFMTRVGGGPFPTELGAARSEEHCRDPRITKQLELERFGIHHRLVDGRASYDHEDVKVRQLMNSTDPFQQGVGIRLAADEYGAVTGRHRRVGWTDGVAAGYAVALNGTSKIVLTKLDAAAGLERFRICYQYEKDGEIWTDFCRDSDFLTNVLPRYRDYEGYGDISSVRRYEDLPESLKKAVSDFEDLTHSSAAIISVGPEAEETIFR